MNKIYQDIEKKVDSLLIEYDIKKAPVSVSRFAKKSSLQLIPYEFGEGISGALLIEDGKATVGYNPKESKVRQRFTIAHEIGHYILHRQNSPIFYDKAQILFRDENNSSGQRKEREANAFAASLLMPKSMINKELSAIRNDKIGITDEEIIKELASRFEVSQIAMTYRLANLGFINF